MNFARIKFIFFFIDTIIFHAIFKDCSIENNHIVCNKNISEPYKYIKLIIEGIIFAFLFESIFILLIYSIKNIFRYIKIFILLILLLLIILFFDGLYDHFI
jgi:hypothetical protein